MNKPARELIAGDTFRSAAFSQSGDEETDYIATSDAKHHAIRHLVTVQGHRVGAPVRDGHFTFAEDEQVQIVS